MRISDWSSDVCSSDLQGFVRLINRENRSGSVQVWGIDDAGQRSPGTITLTLAPNESRQFNSQDMEFNLDPSKGLSGSLLYGGVSAGHGTWRLLVQSDLQLLPMALIRTPDRKRVVWGKSVSVRVDRGDRR